MSTIGFLALARLPLALIVAATGAQTDGKIGARDQAALTGVVVPARKTEENPQRATFAISVVTPDTIARSDIKDPTDLQWRLPAIRDKRSDGVDLRSRLVPLPMKWRL